MNAIWKKHKAFVDGDGCPKHSHNWDSSVFNHMFRQKRGQPSALVAHWYPKSRPRISSRLLQWRWGDEWGIPEVPWGPRGLSENLLESWWFWGVTFQVFQKISAAFWRKPGNRFPWKGLRFQLMHVVFRAWTTDFCTTFFCGMHTNFDVSRCATFVSVATLSWKGCRFWTDCGSISKRQPWLSTVLHHPQPSFSLSGPSPIIPSGPHNKSNGTSLSRERQPTFERTWVGVIFSEFI